MPLARAWVRGLSQASGAAVLVPGGILAALILLALAGSFGRIGGLGEALSGPAASGSSPLAQALTRPVSHASGLPVVSAPAATGRVRAGSTGTAARGAGGVSSTGPTTAPPSAARGGHPMTPGIPAAIPPGAPPGCSSCSHPPVHQTLVDRVVSLGTSVSGKLPGAAGQLTTQSLEHVAAAVDRVLPTARSANTARQLGSTLAQLKLP